MDMQKILTDSVSAARAERFNSSTQLTLGEAILKLEAVIEKVKRDKKPEYQNPDIKFDFCRITPVCLSSWRGSYAELAIEYELDGNKKAIDFLQELKEAVRKTYQGYKGGDFVMSRTTPLWVSNYGESDNTGVYDITYDGYYVIIETGHYKY